jgi:hypothetical protein
VTQPDLWGNDQDVEFEAALRFGRLGALANCAGRRVLAAWEGQDAEALAEALALLRDVLPVDPPADYDPSPFIEANVWHYARTMPDRPHEYLVIHKSTDWREHLVFKRWLEVHGEVERWRDRRDYPYRTIGPFRYWSLGFVNDELILNRRLTTWA